MTDKSANILILEINVKLTPTTSFVGVFQKLRRGQLYSRNILIFSKS